MIFRQWSRELSSLQPSGGRRQSTTGPAYQGNGGKPDSGPLAAGIG
jgi:hypothetical protein